MSGTYQSVITSITVSLIFTICFFVYAVILKRKVNLFVLMILISLLPLVSLLRPGTYESGDFNIHIYRTIDFYNALSQGQIIPSWTENLNGTYGYPLFQFINSLPYYIVSGIHFLGFGFITSMKIYLGLSYLGSGITMWLFTKKLFSNKLAIFTASIFYLFAPYHFVDLHFRAALGEILSFVILPLFFLALYNLVKKPNLYRSTILGLVFGCFILIHHAISIFSLLIAAPYFLYLIWRIPKRQITLSMLFAGLAFVEGFLISIAVWLPHIVLRQYTFAEKIQTTSIMFPYITELFFSSWKYGLLFQGPQGELSFMIGYTQIVVVIVTFILLLTHKIQKNIKSDVIFWITSFAFLFILMTPQSLFFWDNVPLIKSAQFSTRLLVIMCFVIGILSGYFTVQLKKKRAVIYAILFITVGYTILNWGHRRVIPEITDSTLINNVWRSSSEGEGFYGLGSPKWIDFSKPWFTEKPALHLEVLNGDGKIETVDRTSIYHSYIVQIYSDTALLKENTLYFPNWIIYANGKEVPINYESSTYPGVILFNLTKGTYTLEAKYTVIEVIHFARIISLISLLTAIAIISICSVSSRKNAQRK